MKYFVYNYIEKKLVKEGLSKPVEVDPNKEYCLPSLRSSNGTTFVQWLTVLNNHIENRDDEKVYTLCNLYPNFHKAWVKFIFDHLDSIKVWIKISIVIFNIN